MPFRIEPGPPAKQVARVCAGVVCLGMLLSLLAAAGRPGTVMASPSEPLRPYGMSERSAAPRAFLNMPPLAGGTLPKLLSQTGAFEDVRSLTPVAGLIPYEVIQPFWSDSAVKGRYIALPPGGKVGFSPTGEWTFPAGTVFIKTFEIATDAAHPQHMRRLETRLLVRDAAGGVYGVVYKWRPDYSDADLLPTSLAEQIPVRGANGQMHQQTWYYPSRRDCLTCHTALAGRVLGVKARQLDRDLTYPSGVTDNQLRTWNHLGLFSPALTPGQLPEIPRLAAMDDSSRSLQDRARSYLDANCAQCHRPGGTVAYFDARYSTPLDRQELIDGPVLIDEGIDHPHVISPHDTWRSIAYMRADTNGDIRMPPLARETVDVKGMALLRAWILSLPGRNVLAPPQISPAGGTFGKPVSVTLASSDAGAVIHYTLDGSAPGASDPVYAKPIQVTGPTVVRARAYEQGFMRSITAESVFIVGQ